MNNFSDNKLFHEFALEDLAELFEVNLFVFSEQTDINNGSYNDDELKQYKPVSTDPPCTDNIYLNYNKNDRVKYKWLMPKASSLLIKKNLLNPIKQDYYYLKTNTSYSYQFLLLDSQCLFKCFGDCLVNNNLNLLLFLNFLSECSVHTLTSLKDLNFNDLLLSSEDPNEMINYLVNIFYLV